METKVKKVKKVSTELSKIGWVTIIELGDGVTIIGHSKDKDKSVIFAMKGLAEHE